MADIHIVVDDSLKQRWADLDGKVPFGVRSSVARTFFKRAVESLETSVKDGRYDVDTERKPD
jgi:hypothetical protein